MVNGIVARYVPTCQKNPGMVPKTVVGNAGFAIICC